MKIVTVPLESVNDVNFGMMRDEVRRYFGTAKEFKKSRFSKNTSDDFGWCHVYYDEQNKCQAIEIFEGEVFIKDTLVFPADINNIKSLCADMTADSDGYISVINSIGIYLADEKAESIVFAKPGYYKENT